MSLIYRESLEAHPWEPDVDKELEYVEKERQWLLIRGNGGRKMAFLHCYLACQSFTSDDFISWNEDLLRIISREAIILKSKGYIILAMGDFNTHVGCISGLENNHEGVNRNEPMFMNFLKEVNLVILNALPLCKEVFTWFKGSRKSLLDYGLVDGDSVRYVTSFTIDEKARHACGSDHALLECKILFGTTPRLTWKYEDVIYYNFNDNTDFTNYKLELEEALEEKSIEEFSEMTTEVMLEHVTSSINSTAKKVFGLRVKRKRKGRRLPPKIIDKIREKENISKELHEAYTNKDVDKVKDLEKEFDKVKQEVSDSISKGRLRLRNKLRARLLTKDPNRKKFWRFIKTQIKRAGHIAAIENKVI